MVDALRPNARCFSSLLPLSQLCPLTVHNSFSAVRATEMSDNETLSRYPMGRLSLTIYSDFGKALCRRYAGSHSCLLANTSFRRGYRRAWERQNAIWTPRLVRCRARIQVPRGEVYRRCANIIVVSSIWFPYGHLVDLA